MSASRDIAPKVHLNNVFGLLGMTAVEGRAMSECADCRAGLRPAAGAKKKALTLLAGLKAGSIRNRKS